MRAEIKPISGVDDRVCLADAIPLKTPFTLNVFPTNACNFRCNYCAQSLGAEYLKDKYNFSYETMPLDMFEKAVDQLKGFLDKFKLVSFMGHGEPLLHKNLPEMIAMVNNAKIAKRTEIITNGSMLTHELSEKLVRAGISTIRISLQGINSDKYKKISNVDIDFEKFMYELKYFSQIKGESKLFVKVVDTSLDDGDEEKFYELFADVADRMYVEKIKPVYAGVEYEEDVQKVSVDRYGNEHTQRLVCPLTFYMLSLWPNGDVVPCDAIYKPIVLGNVNNDNVVDLWNSDMLKKFQKMQLSKKRFLNSHCKVCCAPDDVSHPLDSLDAQSINIIKRSFKGEG